jgi:hypothetical protein
MIMIKMYDNKQTAAFSQIQVPSALAILSPFSVGTTLSPAISHLFPISITGVFSHE